jgi:putative ABC transport system permease protein
LLVRRGLWQHRLSSAITASSLALACGLVMAVFALREQSYQAFTGGSTSFDAVLGARGSQLQLVLNTVFHLETSPGNIPWSLVQTIEKDPRIKAAVPYAVGDNYKGFRIVGTGPNLFTDFEAKKGEPWRVQAGGRIFDPTLREAVIGNYVARRTGLAVGSRFQPYHGLTYNEKARHDEQYLVVGVLEPTGTPADRALWIPIEGIFRMGGHVLRGTGEAFDASTAAVIPDEAKEASAVMLKLKSPQAGFTLDAEINKQGKVATLAFPIGGVMAELFDKLGWMNRVLEAVAYLTVLVAAGSVLASLYNTMNERRRSLAILRALGARRLTISSAIVLEAAAIAALGALSGYAVYYVILSGAAELVRARTGVLLDANAFHPALIAAPLGIIALGALAGLLPALSAYRTDVAENLQPTS